MPSKTKTIKFQRPGTGRRTVQAIPVGRTVRAIPVKRRNYRKRDSVGRLHFGNGYKSGKPLPDRKYMKLMYSDVFSMGTPAATTVLGTEQIMNLNSLYHPDGTGVGHQPYCYDQMATLYGRYRVYAALVDITFSDPSADGMYWVVNAGEGMLTGRAMNLAFEIDDCAHGFLNNTGSQKSRFKQFLPINRVMGLSKQEVQTNPDYEAAVTASPAAACLFRIAVGKLTTAGGVSLTMNVAVNITYYCVMYEKKQQTQSSV